jgi:GT2 family glycosyltransferase
MKVAAITVTYDDGYKVRQWIDYYNEYKDAIYLLVIVDNGSDPDYLKTVEESFPEAMIIKRTSNGGSTAAYNDGIRHALQIREVDSIMLIGNDIRISGDDVSILYKILFDNEQYGIIMPIIFQKDSDIIADYGSRVSGALYMEPSHFGQKVDESLPFIKEGAVVAGGMNLAKRKYYEMVGLQDEDLFMYSDEIDMGLRMAKTGLKAIITRQACAWHQHINPQNAALRQGYAEFLMRRNKVYLGYKHFGLGKALYIFLKQIAQAPRFAASFLKRGSSILIVYYLLGCFCGIMRIEKNFQTIINNKL